MNKNQDKVLLSLKKNMIIGDSITYKSKTYTKTNKKKLHKTIEEIQKFFSPLVQVEIKKTRTRIQLLF